MSSISDFFKKGILKAIGTVLGAAIGTAVMFVLWSARIDLRDVLFNFLNIRAYPDKIKLENEDKDKGPKKENITNKENENTDKRNKIKKVTIPSNKIAVLIAENDKQIDWPLSSTIASLLEKQKLSITSPPIFNNAFLTSGWFRRLFDGDPRHTELTQLPMYFKAGLLGKKTVVYMTNDDFKDIITATITLELHVISSLSGAVKHSISLSQNGAGLSNADACKNAADKIIQELDAKLPSLANQLGD